MPINKGQDVWPALDALISSGPRRISGSPAAWPASVIRNRQQSSSLAVAAISSLPTEVGTAAWPDSG
ncbi:MAG TPA: hypothetical protein VFA63_14470 [Pseudonocardiaceae bacterium]|jgi:hypothetical protein|nr:hypothetical protein [Pseudonocardiaceae bacterium]